MKKYLYIHQKEVKRLVKKFSAKVTQLAESYNPQAFKTNIFWPNLELYTYFDKD